MAYMLEAVSRVTGATIKQLIHWDSCGLVQPSVAQAQGKGSRRLYSFIDVLAIKMAVTLRREGISLGKVKRCLKYLKDHQPEVEQPLATLNLVTDGASVFLMSDNPGRAVQDRKIVDTLAGGQLLFMVPIGRIACEAQREMARVAPETAAEVLRTDSLGSSSSPSSPGRNTQRRVRTARKGLRAG